nr:maleylacetoacetate isomerase [uncultured Pseudomonas sp.]
MQLYSFFNSSTSYRVRIALALKNVSFEHHGINLRNGEQSSADFTQLNPSASVPLLVEDDGTTLSQSLAIIEYLDSTREGARLIPEDPLQRARVMEASLAVSCDIHPINNLRVLGYLKREFGVSEEQKTAWYRHWVEVGLAALEELLRRFGHGPYCFGDTPTLADCCLVPQVANALRMGCDLERFERVMARHRYCLQQEAFQRAAPERQPDYVV